MKWLQPADCPKPPDWFVRELRLIDPTLRAVWALDRYLREEWAIERKMSAERYWLAYESVMTGKMERFIDQPVFDDAQAIKDPLGNIVGVKQIGIRKLDLAPEWEWIAFRPTLDQKLIDTVRELYWRADHPEEVAEQKRIDEGVKAIAREKKKQEAIAEGVDEAFLAIGKKVQFGAGSKHRPEAHSGIDLQEENK